MKIWKQRVFSPCAFAGIVAIFVFTGCEDKIMVTDLAVTHVTLNAATLILKAGDTKTLTHTILPANAANQNVSWSSSAPLVATVVNGTVTAIAEGETNITVTTRDGRKRATCVVTVSNIAVTSVTLNRTSLILDIEESEQLFPTVLPTDAYNRAIDWSSDNPRVATVTQGTVTGIAEGTANITVSLREGDLKASCAVTVSHSAVSGISLNKSTLALTVGNFGFLTHTIRPPTASNKNVNWTSSPPGVVTIANNMVTAVAPGSATVTVTTEEGGFTATCSVTVTTPSDIEGMVWIKSGTFTMGSPDSELKRWNDETQHQVTLNGFHMGIYPVTQALYQEVTGENWSRFKTSVDGDDPTNRPVEMVSWYEVIVFCNKLSIKEGLSPAYTMYKSNAPDADLPVNRWTDIPANWSTNPADWGKIPLNYYETSLTRWDAVRIVEASNGYRLPTEAQWEYACRAGTPTPFNTGDNITTDQANYNGYYPYNDNPEGIYRQRTTEVNTFAPNDWGLYDMHGNVWEWCWDWYDYDYYKNGAQTDPTGPATRPVDSEFRVVRGGAWNHWAENLRSALRYGEYPYEWDNEGEAYGFRLVRP